MREQRVIPDYDNIDDKAVSVSNTSGQLSLSAPYDSREFNNLTPLKNYMYRIPVPVQCISLNGNNTKDEYIQRYTYISQNYSNYNKIRMLLARNQIINLFIFQEKK